MAKIKLKVNGKNEITNAIMIDGKSCKLKSAKDGTRECEFTTDKERVCVSAFKIHYYSEKHWVLWELFYFFISLLGIFDSRYNSKFYVAEFICDIKTTEDCEIVISPVQKFIDGGEALTISSTNELSVKSNFQTYDTEARNKHKKMKKIKWAIRVTLFILVCLLLIF